MIAPLTPDNEVERLKALKAYNIIDTIEEEDYDYITKLAAQILNTPIALISIITKDKQWFKSHYGLETRETPRNIAFCAHAINNPNSIFVVNDSRKDSRFSDNPLVENAPNVIFYAGVPLVNENGFAFGTLCTIDNKPRELNTSQIETLQILAKQVINLLELRKKTKDVITLNKELEKYTSLFNKSQKLTKSGAWEQDLTTGKIMWTDEVYSIHEVDKTFEPIKENRTSFYHPEYRKRIENALNKTIENNIPLDESSKFITARNNKKWVRTTATIINSKLVGSIQDITSEKEKEIELSYQENLLNTLFEFSPIGITLTDYKTGKFINANKKILQLTSYSKEEFLKLTYWDLIPKKNQEKEKKEHETLIINNFCSSFEKEKIRKDGSSFPTITKAFAVTDLEGKKRIWSYIEDISAQKEAKKEKAQLNKIASLLAFTEEQNNRLRNFAYIVSHNLRSHSGGITSLLELLNEENGTLVNSEIFQFLMKASSNLAETIHHLNEVVEISLAADTKKTIDINLNQFISSTIETISIISKNANVKLINNVTTEIHIKTIPAYLESIILNFLTNGIRYKANRKNSFVKVSSYYDKKNIVIQFQDNGLGIDLQKHKKNLFGMYKTFHDNKESKGIGLFISKRQIEAMGGKIEVESVINKGTTFKIYLPNEK